MSARGSGLPRLIKAAAMLEPAPPCSNALLISEDGGLISLPRWIWEVIEAAAHEQRGGC